MTKAIHFECQIDCSFLCCGGATIVTLDELRKFYFHFPITIAYQKITPFDEFHANYLANFGIKREGIFIIGDFVAGNRLKRKCSKLKNSFCLLHNSGKPLQCRIVPFSVTFPEEYQERVINQRRRGPFKNCKGFSSEFRVVWSNKFEDRGLAEDFYRLRDSIRNQRDILLRILNHVSSSNAFRVFMSRETGILELPIPADFLIEVLEKAKIEKPQEFIGYQKRLMKSELTAESTRNPLFSEALRELEALDI